MATSADQDVDELELQKTLDSKRLELESVAHKPEAKSWLGPRASTEAGTDQLLEELERCVDRDDFSRILSDERRSLQERTAASTLSGSEVLRPEWWEPVPGPMGVDTVEEATGEYVVIEHSDVVDALAAFLAAYIVALPEGRDMEPKQLQRAVRQSLQEIRKGRVKRLWDWGRFLYRAAAMSYGAFAAYTNPWVAEAVLKALFTCARFARTFW